MPVWDIPSSRMTEKYAKVIALLNKETAEKTTKAFNLFGDSFKNHSVINFERKNPVVSRGLRELVEAKGEANRFFKKLK